MTRFIWSLLFYNIFSARYFDSTHELDKFSFCLMLCLNFSTSLLLKKRRKCSRSSGSSPWDYIFSLMIDSGEIQELTQVDDICRNTLNERHCLLRFMSCSAPRVFTLMIFWMDSDSSQLAQLIITFTLAKNSRSTWSLTPKLSDSMSPSIGIKIDVTKV